MADPPADADVGGSWCHGAKKTGQYDGAGILRDSVAVRRALALAAIEDDDGAAAVVHLLKASAMAPFDLGLVAARAEAYIRLTDYSSAKRCLSYVIHCGKHDDEFAAAAAAAAADAAAAAQANRIAMLNAKLDFNSVAKATTAIMSRPASAAVKVEGGGDLAVANGAGGDGDGENVEGAFLTEVGGGGDDPVSASATLADNSHLAEAALARLAEVHFFDAEARFDAGEHMRAFGLYGEASAITPGGGYAGRRFRRLLQCLVQLGRLPEALAAIDAAIGRVDTAAVAAAAANPGFVATGPVRARSLRCEMSLTPRQVVDLYLMRAQLRVEHRSFVGALSDIASALIIEPANRAARRRFLEINEGMAHEYGLAAAAFAAGDPASTIGRLRPLLQLEPDNPKYLLLAGQYCISTHRHREAVDHLLCGIENVDGSRSRSRSRNRGDANEAARPASQTEGEAMLRVLQQQLGVALVHLAAGSRAAGNPGAAIALLHEAICADPNSRDALVARGDSFYDDGQLAMALTDYRSALDFDLAKGENGDQARIRCSSVLCAMGTLEFEAQQHLKAEQIFSRAIEFNSRDPNLRVCRAWARVHLGSIEMELRAKSDALLALQIDPTNESALALVSKIEASGGPRGGPAAAPGSPGGRKDRRGSRDEFLPPIRPRITAAGSRSASSPRKS